MAAVKNSPFRRSGYSIRLLLRLIAEQSNCFAVRHAFLNAPSSIGSEFFLYFIRRITRPFRRSLLIKVLSPPGRGILKDGL